MKLFILGCQRSGTTLLKMIFGSRSDITMIDHDLEHIHSLSSSTDHCIKAPQLVYRSKYIRDKFPNAKFICVFREPKDVVSSMMSFGTRDSWANGYRQGEGARNNMVFDGENSIHQECARIYEAKAKCLLNWHTPVCFVHYKDLTKRPKTTIRGMCKYLGMEFDECMLQHHKYNKDARRIGGMNFKKPIFVNAGKWKTVLSQKEAREVDSIARSSYSAYLSSLPDFLMM